MLNGIRNTFITLSLIMPAAAMAEAPDAKAFKNMCVSAWMKSAPDGDKVDYQDFGEKYCSCAAEKPLTSQEDVNKAAQFCMGKILLRTISDRLEESPGLDKVASKDVEQACKGAWTMITSPGSGAPPAEMVSQFCACVEPQMVKLAKKNEELTDSQWYVKVDAISAGCPLVPEASKKAP
ncbi:hypothetical protein Lgee_1760 [Legionella geestiana]|uniref:Uncharacterized protein n=1 Tax=Legionella geestiana TaxID=45065 RepID=A0A0W0TPD3_9GAMM|nr:hypothetical protein [Legionella geestiana]KTC97439.1 hypothetical protein Lgee_1760 [Legionella geestiana]QBS11256.1 hypothetical protein E4T54_00045 [Legionella geestiana]QDQ40951.1 hypothetical protein E3226_011315 [Legionella geestiana]STX54116.1 Uncharacterised protein [Legionella geestiana]